MRLRITVRRMTFAVAVVAIALWVWVLCECPPDDLPRVTFVTVIAVPFALLAIRWPLITLSLGVLYCIGEPNVGGACHHLVGPEAFAGGWLGWFVGAPAGWISRGLRAPTRQKTPPPPEPEELLMPSGRGSIPAAPGATCEL